MKGLHREPDKLLNDGSVKIVAAHSPLRELQILKEELSLVLQKNPDWQPHDIAVLTPNIEPYSPFIEAVFGQEQAGSQALPYSISEAKKAVDKAIASLNVLPDSEVKEAMIQLAKESLARVS